MTVDLKVPVVGESITEVELGEWFVSPGDVVDIDQPIVVIETDKITVEVPSPARGVLKSIVKNTGETAEVGEAIAVIEENMEAVAPPPPRRKPAVEIPRTARAEAAAPSAPQAPTAPGTPLRTAPTEPRVMPAARRMLEQEGLKAADVTPSGPGGRMLKEDVQRRVSEPASASTAPPAAPPAPAASPAPATPSAAPPSAGPPADAPASAGHRAEDVVPMTPMRRRIAERLVEAQSTAALLTTVNEIDMSFVKALRKKHQLAFQEKYGVKLGFMSFFVRAAVDALRLVPAVNAQIRGKDIVYHDYQDIGIAVGGGKGLVVPVLRNAESMGLAEIELAIGDFAARARENRIQMDDITGGTFTISNGGIYGSLLSTPIVNPPQSAILGLHAIQDRPIAIDGQAVVRPMMYVALTYDHRLIDGREAVTFLKRIKECVEEPARMLVEI